MSQKKWQICGMSRLHILCHSGYVGAFPHNPSVALILSWYSYPAHLRVWLGLEILERVALARLSSEHWDGRRVPPCNNYIATGAMSKWGHYFTNFTVCKNSIHNIHSIRIQPVLYVIQSAYSTPCIQWQCIGKAWADIVPTAPQLHRETLHCSDKRPKKGRKRPKRGQKYWTFKCWAVTLKLCIIHSNGQSDNFQFLHF